MGSMNKKIIYLFMFVGLTLGSFAPKLWGASMLGGMSVLFSVVGGFLGIWLGSWVGKRYG